MNYTDVRWGQMYHCTKSSVPEDLKSIGGPYEGSYSQRLNRIRTKWIVNAVLISDSHVTRAGGAAFVRVVEGQAYAAYHQQQKRALSPAWGPRTGRS